VRVVCTNLKIKPLIPVPEGTRRHMVYFINFLFRDKFFRPLQMCVRKRVNQTGSGTDSAGGEA
jgi:hypothetical protein